MLMFPLMFVVLLRRSLNYCGSVPQNQTFVNHGVRFLATRFAKTRPSTSTTVIATLLTNATWRCNPRSITSQGPLSRKHAPGSQHSQERHFVTACETRISSVHSRPVEPQPPAKRSQSQLAQASSRKLQSWVLDEQSRGEPRRHGSHKGCCAPTPPTCADLKQYAPWAGLEPASSP